jgi:hypothetical protein
MKGTLLLSEAFKGSVSWSLNALVISLHRVYLTHVSWATAFCVRKLHSLVVYYSSCIEQWWVQRGHLYHPLSHKGCKSPTMVQLLSVHVIFTMGSLSFESFMVSFTYCMIHLSVCSGELAEGLYNMVIYSWSRLVQQIWTYYLEVCLSNCELISNTWQCMVLQTSYPNIWSLREICNFTCQVTVAGQTGELYVASITW